MLGSEDISPKPTATSTSVSAQQVTGLGTGGMIKHFGEYEPFWFSDAKYAHMRLVDTQSEAQEIHDSTQHLHALLRQATSLVEESDIVCKAITEKLAKSMMMAIDFLQGNWRVTYSLSPPVHPVVGINRRTLALDAGKCRTEISDA